MALPKIDPSELIPSADYQKQREARRREIIELKALRRIEVGPWISFVFENRATVLHQLQEMLLIEHITSPGGILHEIETYEELLPAPGELSATCFIEITDDKTRDFALSQLFGIEKTISFKVGDTACPAKDKRPIDPRFIRLGRASAVYYLGFSLDSAMRQAFTSPQTPAWIEISHPQYGHMAKITAETRASLIKGLV